jgi:hypothetical protein
MTRPSLRHLAVAVVAVAAAWIVSVPASRAEDVADDKTIVFVCQHGVVNSQMAAAYFNKVARERGLPFKAVSRGIDMYWTIPVRIQDGLALDGLEPANLPNALTASDAKQASRILAFDPIPAERKGDANVSYWPGVPLGIQDYEAARDEIARRVDALAASLADEKSK